MSFQTCMFFFLPWCTKEDILKKMSAISVCTTKKIQKHWTPLSFIVKEKDIERDFKIPPFVSQWIKTLQQFWNNMRVNKYLFLGGGWTTPLRSDHSLKKSHDYMLSIGQLCVCTCASSLSYMFFVFICLLLSVWKRSWHFTNMHVYVVLVLLKVCVYLS